MPKVEVRSDCGSGGPSVQQVNAPTATPAAGNIDGDPNYYIQLAEKIKIYDAGERTLLARKKSF